MFVLVFQRKPVSGIDSTVWKTCNISIHIKRRKNKKKNEKKIFGLQLFGTSAGLRNTLKMNERILTKVKRKSKRIFDTLKLLRLFNIQDQNVRKSQEIP